MLLRVPVVLPLALAIAAAACTTQSDRQRQATFDAAACPPEVAVAFVTPISCGYVTVPEDRSDPGGPSVRVFVFRVVPDGPAAQAPVLFIGSEIGFSLDYTNVAAVATSLPGHELIGVELRGTGHSEPNLSCPEVDALSGRARAEPIDDPGMRASFLSAVASCRARIVAAGVDPAAYDIAALGADLLDVVAALGLTSWDVLSKGSTSRVVFEAMRSDPQGLRAVVLHNPEFPDTDPFVQAFESTRASVALLEDACDAERVCGKRFPSVVADVQSAIDRLEATPVRVRVGGNPVFMDGAAFLRSLRVRLSGMSPATGADLPATIAAIAHDPDPARTLKALSASDQSAQTYCSGYLPCSSAQTLNQGAHYSVLCRDEVPFTDASGLNDLGAGDPAWSADYVDSPYLDVCNAWDVQPASPTEAEPVTSDVPIYIDSGAFSPFVGPAALRAGTTGLSNPSLGVSPLGGDAGVFGAAGVECLDARLAFLDDPQTPVDFSCHDAGPLRFTSEPI